MFAHRGREGEDVLVMSPTLHSVPAGKLVFWRDTSPGLFEEYETARRAANTDDSLTAADHNAQLPLVKSPKLSVLCDGELGLLESLRRRAVRRTWA